MKNMDPAAFYEAWDRLIASGWTIWEIERLCHFRDNYQQTNLDLLDLNLDIRQLEFLRWLVQTGKLSEYADQEKGIA